MSILKLTSVWISVLLMTIISVKLIDSVTEVGQFFHNDAQLFDKDYNKGKWDYLNQIPVERSRCSLISVACDSYIPKNASILDIGCGEGVLTDYLHRSMKRNYVGIDFSQKAIDIALEKRPKLQFFREDAVKYKPTRLYDAIVFNEVLYYVKHNEVMKYYSDYLTPQGIIIISNWYLDNPKSDFENLANIIFDDIVKLGFVAVDEFHLTGFKKTYLKNKVSFRITVFRKR